MDWLRQIPERPYRNLLLATLAGVPAGSLVFAVAWMAVGEFSTGYPRWMPLADAIPATLFAYPAALAVLLVYALPMLWAALRLEIAGPGVALVAAVLPWLAIALAQLEFDATLALVTAMSLGCGVAFVLLAYRRPPAEAGAAP